MAAAPLLQSRDTVSQPVASTQRPGRIYHADDFTPGLQRRREPPLVASAVADARRAEGSNGTTAHAANGELRANGSANHSTALASSKISDDSLRSEQPLLASASRSAGPAPAADAEASRRPRNKPQKPKPPAKPKAKPNAQSSLPLTDVLGESPVADPAPEQPLAAEVPAADGPAEAVPKAAQRALEGVQRDLEALAQCMACDICREVLLDPVKSPVCMHCYCRECIDAFLVLGGTSNCCPVCQSAAVATSLGRDPYKDNLKYDFVMESLIRKVFPSLAEDTARMAARAVKRAALNAALAAQRASAVVAVDRFPKRLRTDGQDVVELFVSGPGDLELEQPYLRVHRTMPASTLAHFLKDRLREAGHDAEEVQLTCDGARLHAEEQLGAVLEQRWRAVPASGQLLIIEYSLKPGSCSPD